MPEPLVPCPAALLRWSKKSRGPILVTRARGSGLPRNRDHRRYKDANPPLLWRGCSHYFSVMRASKGKPTSAKKSSVAKRSIVFNGHKTSVSLEDEFWNALKEIAGKRAIRLSDLVAEVDEQRGDGNLSSALRLFVLDYYQRP